MYSDTESLDRADLRALQADRLRETVEHAYENVPFYRDKLDESGVAPKTSPASRISPGCR